MGRRWVRDRPLLVAGVVLIAVAVILAVRLYVLPSGQRDAAFRYAEFVFGLVGLVITVLGLLRDARRPVEPRPLDTLADLLAQAVHTQWRAAAAERVLVIPPPIPVGWSLSNLPVAGPVEVALGDPDVAPAFPPLPGQTRVTQEQLLAGGGCEELFAVYAGIASGRVVVVGAPGAGKTATAILLLLDALEHRDRVNNEDRVRVPVPVLLTVHGWDPTICAVQDWLVARLAASYPLFQHRGGQAEATALVGAGVIALILDGLDEMNGAWRPAALQALSDASFRVVVLARSQEMVQAAGVAWLAGAIALEVRDVTGTQAADYLYGARSGPAPAGWTQLLTHLRKAPDSVLTHGLSTPLALSLIRDTYRAGDDLSDLLDATRWSTPDDLAQHLIAGVLPDAYTRRPGRPEPRYSLSQAKQALVFLARQMNQDHTRDLAWWHIPRWAPAPPRIVASVLLGGLLGALVGGLTFLLGEAVLGLLGEAVVGRLWNSLQVRQTFLFGPTFGLGVGLSLGFWFGRGGHEPKRVRTWRAIRVRSVLAAGLVYALGYALAVTLVGLLLCGLALWPAVAFEDTFKAIPDTIWGIAIFLVLGLAVGLTLGLNRDLLGGPGEGEDRSRRPVSRRHARITGIAAGIVTGIASGIVAVSPPGPSPLWVGIVVGLLFGLGAGLVVRLVVVLVVWLVPRVAGGFVTGLAVEFTEGEGSPQGPRESWRNDRVFGLVAGLAFGLAFGLVVGLAFGLAFGLYAAKFRLGSVIVVGLLVGLTVGVVVGLVYGITSSETWSTTLAWRLQLQRSPHVPAVGLMPFLEDARARGVLRTVGGVYQFRHATLQDQLAGQITTSPSAS